MHHLNQKATDRSGKAMAKNKAMEICTRSAFCLAWIILLVLLLLCAAAKVTCMIDLAEIQYIPLTTSIASFGILAGTFLFAMRSAKHAAISALFGGILFWGLIMIIGILRQEPVNGLAILKLFSFSAAGAFGAMLGNLTKEYKKSHRHLR